MSPELTDLIKKEAVKNKLWNPGINLVVEIKKTKAGTKINSDNSNNHAINSVNKDEHVYGSNKWKSYLVYALTIMLSAFATSFAIKNDFEKKYYNEFVYNTSYLNGRIDSLENIINNLKKELKGKNEQLKIYQHNSKERKELEKEISHLKDKIKSINQYSLDGILIDNNYDLVVIEKDLTIPFNIPQEIIKVAKDIGKTELPNKEKAREIFNWVENNIRYGEEETRVYADREYRNYKNSKEVLYTGKGVCGELAYLYVTMARLAGLESNWVHVTEDYKSKKVHHACASVKINRDYILVDLTYHRFDIQHNKYDIMNDKDATDMFTSMRKRRS